MKRIGKRVLALAMALCLLLALGTTALAAEVTNVEAKVAEDGGTAQAGKKITKITLTANEGSVFAESFDAGGDYSTYFTINGAGVGVSGATVTGAQRKSDQTNVVDLTVDITPTKQGELTITVKKDAFSGDTTLSEAKESIDSTAISIGHADAPAVTASSTEGLTAGKQGTITLTSSANHFKSGSQESWFTLTGGATGSPSEVSGGGETVSFSATPSSTAPISIEISREAFTYTPASNVTGVTVSVAAPSGTVKLDGEALSLTTGTAVDSRTVTLTAEGIEFNEGDLSTSITLDGAKDGLSLTAQQTTNTTATLTLTGTPTTAGELKVNVAQGAFKYTPTISGSPLKIADIGLAAAPTIAQESSDLTAGKADGTVKLKISGGNQFTDKGTFTFDGDVGLTAAYSDGADSDTVTLTITGTPAAQGSLTIKASANAFKYAYEGGGDVSTNVDVGYANVSAQVEGTLTQGVDGEIKVTLTGSEFVSEPEKNLFTLEGGGVTEPASVTTDGATATLKVTPTQTGEIKVTSIGTAALKYKPDAAVPGEKISGSATVGQPSGTTITAALVDGATLTAGTAADEIKITLTADGTLKFKAELTDEDIKMGGEGASGLSFTGVGSDKTATLTLKGTPSQAGKITFTVEKSAFVYEPESVPSVTGEISVGYPEVSVTPDPGHLVEDDATVTSIKLTAVGSKFNEVDETGEITNFSFTDYTDITLKSVKAGADSEEAVLTFTGTPEKNGTLTITVQPDAFKYKPEKEVTATVTIDQPTGTLKAEPSGDLYAGTPADGTTITLTIEGSKGLHFQEGLTADDFALDGTFTGLSIKEAAFVSTLEATLTLEGTPEQNGSFKVKALTSAFKAAPTGDQTAAEDIAVKPAPTGSVTAALKGTLSAGTAVTDQTITLTADGLTFKSAPDKADFVLSEGADGLTVASVSASGSTATLTLSGTPKAAGTFTVTVKPTAFAALPTDDVKATGDITIGTANVTLTASGSTLTAGTDGGSVKLTAAGSAFKADLTADMVTVAEGGTALGTFKVSGVTAADGTVTVTIAGMPATEGTIKLTVSASAFDPAPAQDVTVELTVAPGRLTTQTEAEAGAPGMNFATADSELAAAVLTEEEQALYEKGAQVLIELEETNIDSTVSAEDKAAVTAAAGSYTVGEYLDVSLYKQINGGERTAVSTTSSAIRVVFTIPESLRASGRQFAIARVHDGSATLLKTVSSSASTITVETNQFSTYAILYRQAPAGSTAAPEDSVPDTGDGTSVLGWAALLTLCGAALVLTLTQIKRRREH